ncbi:ArsR/SmtB family transcription factor [Mycolicibacterium arenosum]|uniref:Metalloregulator ArsR/SmtB family transcription factor n=1 Tax=Mycolicibacterium arenosum TaxID=2952157 RepID=A0ABT1LX50_9MYCO|nr:metalloregulator ArsR/SmtB family transcription factor [Mycolicibacterium sp. CAU 1645]MCP9271466.1 metalloregulator ArsR/SmtB family transcription factor [Mycolicibacterium sp. CAU 1645]
MPTTDVAAVDLSSCCSPLTGGSLEPAAAERLAHIFKALSDPARVRLLSLIAAAEGAEACICDLTEPLALSQPTVSHHMKQLVEAGLVSREQRGKWAYFRVVDRALAQLAAVLTPARTNDPELARSSA